MLDRLNRRIQARQTRADFERGLRSADAKTRFASAWAWSGPVVMTLLRR